MHVRATLLSGTVQDVSCGIGELTPASRVPRLMKMHADRRCGVGVSTSTDKKQIYPVHTASMIHMIHDTLDIIYMMYDIPR